MAQNALLCVLYACSNCGHPEGEHDGFDGACMDVVEINDLGAVLCACSGFSRAEATRAEGTGER